MIVQKRSDASAGSLSALLSKRRLGAADVTVFANENADVDVAEAGEVVAERVGLLTAELEQERTPASTEAWAVGQHAPEDRGTVALPEAAAPATFAADGRRRRRVLPQAS